MKKIWRNKKKYVKKYENKDSPYVWAVGLGKIPSSSSYLGEERGCGGGSQFPGLGFPQRKDMKDVKSNQTKNVFLWRLKKS